MLGWDRAIDIVGKVVWEQNTSFVLVAIPMFIFMGELLFQSGIMSTVYLRAATVVSGIPGGLLQANIAACTIFAACSGSSVASAATIGSVGYPEIAKRGYSKPIALGSIAAGGTLGILIPPSIIFIVYGSLAEVSIGKLFLAGVAARAGAVGALFDLHRRPLPGGPVAGAAAAPRGCHRARACGARPVADGPADRGRARRHLRRHRQPHRGCGARRQPGDPDLAHLAASSVLRGLWRAGFATVRQTSMILFVIFTAKILAVTLIYFQVPAAMVAWIGAAEMTAGHIFSPSCWSISCSACSSTASP